MVFDLVCRITNIPAIASTVKSRITFIENNFSLNKPSNKFYFFLYGIDNRFFLKSGYVKDVYFIDSVRAIWAYWASYFH